jgi:hypothetical protein
MIIIINDFSVFNAILGKIIEINSGLVFQLYVQPRYARC